MSTVEWETLHSLNRAYLDLRQEWESARAQTGHAMTRIELTEGYAQHSPFPYHLKALDAALTAACQYEQQIGELAWRYASASVVLGITVLDRLVGGRPPLTADAVEQLAGTEPTLAQLREAFSIPSSRLYVAREDRERQRSEEDREKLVSLVQTAYYNITHEDIDGRRPTEAEAGAYQLTVASQEGMDPFWEDLLPPVLRLAEQIPFEMCQWLKHIGARHILR